MSKRFTKEDAALLQALGVQAEVKKVAKLSPRQERLIAGFEDLQRFYQDQGRLPKDREDRDIFERLYAVRLAQIAQSAEDRRFLTSRDHQGLLAAYGDGAGPNLDDLDDEALLKHLGVDQARPAITQLDHVRSQAEKKAEKKAVEDIANRQPCEDFDTFQPLFEEVQHDLAEGKRQTRKFELKSEIEQGRFFIVNGQIAYVDQKRDLPRTDHGKTDARLRVIYDNGTQSDLLMRSLQRALNKDPAGRRITDPVAGPLFSSLAEEGDQVSGTIYVLRSKSKDPRIEQNRDLIHKIGVTTNSVEQRIAGAHLQTTFLMAPVEIVATYEAYDISPIKLENLIHKVFSRAKLEIEIPDRMGRPIVPREWFLVPFIAIQEAVNHIIDGSIEGKIYDPKSASFIDAA